MERDIRESREGLNTAEDRAEALREARGMLHEWQEPPSGTDDMKIEELVAEGLMWKQRTKQLDEFLKDEEAVWEPNEFQEDDWDTGDDWGGLDDNNGLLAPKLHDDMVSLLIDEEMNPAPNRRNDLAAGFYIGKLRALQNEGDSGHKERVGI